MEDVMLTTIDNPYNPFFEFEKWKNFDESNGYYSCSLLARVIKSSNELSEEDESLAINEAIDEIVKENLSGVHKKITR